MGAAPIWDQLSRSSKEALRWAAALAALRVAGATTTPQPINADDLLVGLVLSHPQDGEAGVLLDHFGFGLRPALDPGYPDINLDRLAVVAERLSGDGPPELEADAEAALEAGVERGLSSGSAKVAELRGLVGGLLRASTPTGTRLQTLIGDAGTSLDELLAAYDEYLRRDPLDSSEDGDLRGMLRRRFPRRPVSIPDYKADQVDRRGDGDDLLGIHAEVDAFAYLLASRGLSPPLAVGLFGDWGSGKSFYMRSMRRRIEQLTGREEARRSPQVELPFWKHIVQIDFNAWHYVEGSLWASLVDHIFTHLATSGDDPPNVLAERRREVLGRLEHVARERDLAVQRRTQVRDDLRARREAARQARQTRDERQRALDQAKVRAFESRLAERTREDLAELLFAGDGAQGSRASPSELLAALDNSRELLVRGRGVLGPYWRGGWRAAVTVAGAAAVPAGVAVLQAVQASAGVQLAGAIGAAMAYVTTVISAANRYLRHRLDRIAEVRREVEDAQQAAEQQYNAEVRAAQQAVDEAEEELREAASAEDALRREADQLHAELATLTPTRILTDFVTERAGADDYRRYLGVAALIRKDFEQLADLIRDHNEAVVRGEEDQLGINRIILYIDDLDRCPAHQVVEVLQAVHLLLAFDLFVVVVAVDSRWLSDALIDQHPTLVAQSSPRHATPQDYLEKIFQLPFWVQALEDGGRRDLVRGLLGPNVVSPDDAHDSTPSRDGLRLTDTHRTVLQGLLSAEGRPHLRAETLDVTAEELRFIDGLAPLLGDTPRSVKRFVNVYQLLAAMPAIAYAHPQQPPARSLAAFLAAANEAAPSFTPALTAALAEPFPDATLGSLIDGGPPVKESDRQRLEAWLVEHPDWRVLPLERLAPMASLVRRLSFQAPTTRPASRQIPFR